MSGTAVSPSYELVPYSLPVIPQGSPVTVFTVTRKITSSEKQFAHVITILFAGSRGYRMMGLTRCLFHEV